MRVKVNNANVRVRVREKRERSSECGVRRAEGTVQSEHSESDRERKSASRRANDICSYGTRWVPVIRILWTREVVLRDPMGARGDTTLAPAFDPC